jgi:hypothetical protein
MEKQIAHRIQDLPTALATKTDLQKQNSGDFNQKEQRKEEEHNKITSIVKFYLPLPRFGLAGAKPHPIRPAPPPAGSTD